jgi:pimeloyl-ACP methyl ester carboxylesterase
MTAAVAALTLAVPAMADAPGVKTLDIGTGPTVVLVPSLGGSRTDWLQTVKRLREHYHCVVVNIAGQEDNPLPDPFSLQAAAAQLDGVVAMQKPDSTIVVGMGVGGLLGLMVAVAHPDHLRGVMMIDAQIKSPVPIPEQERDQVVKFMDDNYDQFAHFAFAKMGRDSVENSKLFAMMTAVPANTVKAYFRQLMGVDGNSDLHALKVPLALAFTDRLWKPGMSWGTFAKALGYEDSTIAVPRRLNGAGPFVAKEQPDTLAALVSAFAQRAYAGKK